MLWFGLAFESVGFLDVAVHHLVRMQKHEPEQNLVREIAHNALTQILKSQTRPQH